MLSFNDALNHSTELVQCFACDNWVSVNEVHWYEDTSSLVFDGTQSVVPVCPTCHAYPTQWLPLTASPSYLANREHVALPAYAASLCDSEIF
jgi:hypothetical protein